MREETMERHATLGYLERYDLSADPGEHNNLAPERPDVLTRMLRLEHRLVSTARRER